MKLFKKEPIAGKCDPSPFMIRYHVISGKWGGILIHRFMRSDDDRDLHDHPWGFVAVILRGGYEEETVNGIAWKRVGSILFRRAEWTHAIRLRPGMEGKVWSLVIKGPYRRIWGFYAPSGWVKWDEYIDAKVCD